MGEVSTVSLNYLKGYAVRNCFFCYLSFTTALNKTSQAQSNKVDDNKNFVPLQFCRSCPRHSEKPHFNPYIQNVYFLNVYFTS